MTQQQALADAVRQARVLLDRDLDGFDDTNHTAQPRGLPNHEVVVGEPLLLGVLSGVFAGFAGVLVFGISAVIGMIPVRFGARRVHLMGVLIVPIVAGV